MCEVIENLQISLNESNFSVSFNKYFNNSTSLAIIGISFCVFAVYEFLQICALMQNEELALLEFNDDVYLIIYPIVDITGDIIIHFCPHSAPLYTPPSVEISSLIMDLNTEVMIDFIRQKKVYHRRQPISNYLPHALISDTMQQLLHFNTCGPTE